MLYASELFRYTAAPSRDCLAQACSDAAGHPTGAPVYAFFRPGRGHGLVTKFHDRPCGRLRGLGAEPAAGIIDAKSVRAALSVDVTHVTAWAGAVYAAFFVDTCSRRIFGRRTALLKKTHLVLPRCTCRSVQLWDPGS